MTRSEFKNIYNLHGKAIRNYIYYRSGNADVADDITQETFIKVWEKQLKYQPQKIKSLLYKIANQMFVDLVRRNKFEANYVEQLKFKLKEGVEKTEDNEFFRKKCETALKKLTEKERTVFLMSRKDEMKYAEIADCLNISQKAVEKRMTSALKKLRAIS